MQTTITGRHLRIPDETREFIEERLERFLRYFNRISSVQVTVSPQQDEVNVELVVHVIRGVTLVAAERAADAHAALDLAAEKIERKLIQLKEKIQEHRAKKVQSGSGKEAEAEKEAIEDYLEDAMEDLREELT
ncbi:MAG: ribosome-associated translation inhibitor RaiA [Planctomycetes bacterium]|nr:ribosome-associated translation inhibitor RaiA [Planctomycetota bacterium]